MDQEKAPQRKDTELLKQTILLDIIIYSNLYSSFVVSTASISVVFFYTWKMYHTVSEDYSLQRSAF